MSPVSSVWWTGRCASWKLNAESHPRPPPPWRAMVGVNTDDVLKVGLPEVLSRHLSERRRRCVGLDWVDGGGRMFGSEDIFIDFLVGWLVRSCQGDAIITFLAAIRRSVHIPSSYLVRRIQVRWLPTRRPLSMRTALVVDLLLVVESRVVDPTFPS